MALPLFCPECNQLMVLNNLDTYPIDEEIQYELDHTEDLKSPNSWSENLYNEYVKIIGDDSVVTKSPPYKSHVESHVESHSNQCSISDKDVVVIYYYFLDHEKRLGGMSFRIVKIF